MPNDETNALARDSNAGASPQGTAAVLTVFAVYRADAAGPYDDDDGMAWTCVAIFGELEDAIAEARAYLVAEGRSVWIDIGQMTAAEWDALDEVPDDFAFAPHVSLHGEKDGVSS
jgi:hypothetical protein